MVSINFDNSYANLPNNFYQRVNPQMSPNPKLIYFNTLLADSLNIQCDHDTQESEQITRIFSGNEIPNLADPIALAYAGHQFGQFVPQLGDGRAILLGEVIDKENKRFDIQLKGSGITPYSRSGDGKAALGPVIRECIVSEAMHALGIKSTRTLAAITTGEHVIRNRTHLPGAVLTRVATSHIRIGTFEYFASRFDIKSLKILADYVIKRHYPQVESCTSPYIMLFEQICYAHIDLIVDWMRVGFIHGVMNTDNAAISGETIDYGPCAFLDEYDPNKFFSYIDHHGRYRFSNQAQISLWNLMQLANSLALIVENNIKDTMNLFHSIIAAAQSQYESKYLNMMCKKIGIIQVQEEDRVLVDELLDIMYKSESDYTLTFRYLTDIIVDNSSDYSKIFTLPEELSNWLPKWYDRLGQEDNNLEEIHVIMLKTNPATIPRNHKIEECIDQAVKNEDFSKMNSMMQILSDPYNLNKKEYNSEYMAAPKQGEHVHQTFCGT